MLLSLIDLLVGSKIGLSWFFLPLFYPFETSLIFENAKIREFEK